MLEIKNLTVKVKNDTPILTVVIWRSHSGKFSWMEIIC